MPEQMQLGVAEALSRPLTVRRYAHDTLGESFGVVTLEEGFWVARVHPQNGDELGRATARAYATRFAATSDLLGALRAMRDAYVNGATGTVRQELVKQADAAVAKATGGES